jgi:phage tail sheath protein FI
MAISTLPDHGVSFREAPTGVISPIIATAGLNVVIGAAPVFTFDDWSRMLNRPILCRTFGDAIEFFGYSSDWKNYPICEHMDSAFRMFGVAPNVYINPLNPAVHRSPLLPTKLTLVNGQINTGRQVILKYLKVTEPDAGDDYERDADYLATYDPALNLVITRLSGGDIPNDTSQIEISGFVSAPNMITKDDIIGGIDSVTGQAEGIEAVEDVFSQTGLVPGILLAPGWSSDPEVAAVLETKASDINGCFKCRCCIDVADTIRKPIDVLPWKTTNNIVSKRQDCGFLYIGLGERLYHFSSQWGPLQMHTDATRGAGVPYVSPSNKPLKANKTCLADGTELLLNRAQANGLNFQGVVTALNWGIYGWKGWGNRTAAGGGQSPDIKDKFIPNAKMGDWLGNTFVLTFHAYVDDPANRRLIDLVVNSFNRWLDGLQPSGALLGGRIEFRHAENPTDQLMDGHIVFRTFYLSPPPAEWIENIFEVDIGYFDVLFEEAA